MPWVKGESGNPGGRPKELEGIQKLARENAPLAIQTLVEVATKGKSESARVTAANALLDRGFGKPKQFVSDNRDPPVRAADLTDDVLAGIIRQGQLSLQSDQAARNGS
jgi:hypothetical protein